MINWLGAIGAGVIEALVMTLMTDASRMMGLIRADLSRYQGCIVLGRSEGFTPWVAGLGAHLTMGRCLRSAEHSFFPCCGARPPGGMAR